MALDIYCRPKIHGIKNKKAIFSVLKHGENCFFKKNILNFVV